MTALQEKENVIVLAENDSIAGQSHKENLQLAGYNVELVFDGREAIAKLEALKEKPLLVLLDVMLPKQGGFKVLQYIKQNKHLSSVPVIILTNTANEDDAEKALEQGAILYLFKDMYTDTEIADKIKEIISGYSKKQRKGVPEVKEKINLMS